eukprot:GHUV01013003.1.p1 GENE.GHUV01013003.1~~GHUV01013003.1.p1  ORF type:complete len:184 (+),score=56.22 GHUV01013003.1:332-883(+)
MRRALVLAARAACGQQTSTIAPVQPASQAAWQHLSRAYSQPAQDDQDSEEVSEKVQQLANNIMALSVLECSQLSNLLRDKLGIPRGAAMPMAMPMAVPQAAAAAGAAAAPEPVEEKKEKTEFDVKLESFTPEGKIKVIKEIRSITNLGLKEAKELVSNVVPMSASWCDRVRGRSCEHGCQGLR